MNFNNNNINNQCKWINLCLIKDRECNRKIKLDFNKDNLNKENFLTNFKIKVLLDNNNNKECQSSFQINLHLICNKRNLFNQELWGNLMNNKANYSRN